MILCPKCSAPLCKDWKVCGMCKHKNPIEIMKRVTISFVVDPDEYDEDVENPEVVLALAQDMIRGYADFPPLREVDISIE